ncbi:hypothetical protein R1flu_023795 [Riccia fluitans]|uniref:Rab-GAP TBC domain-containing protein n=1 Tax=Riccia fluitans TaxID=41844 RepID=A0ABD1XX47_9MARC
MPEEFVGQVLGAVDQVVGLLNIDEVFRLLNMPSNRKQADYGTALVLGVATVAVAAVVGGIVYFYDGRRAPWNRRKKHHPLTKPQWLESFDSNDGRLKDGGEKVLYKARKGGIDISIRAEVWPFLLGLYDLKSNAGERQATDSISSAEFEDLRRQCEVLKAIISSELNKSNLEKDDSGSFEKVSEEDLLESIWEDGDGETSTSEPSTKIEDNLETTKDGDLSENNVSSEPQKNPKVDEILAKGPKALEDFKDWMRIIRLDAVRMNAEWVPYSAVQANVSEEEASRRASEVGIQDDDHLEASRRHHAARLVAVLEAYALYDSDTGYCQGMSDLLSPFVALMESDSQAFWCFVEFMKVAKANFRMDETGIRRQLRLVGQIIKCTDPQLHEHLVKIQADDCYFVYRMVVVLLRRELSFEQTVCLWEVIWADWAALRLEAAAAAAGGSRSLRDALKKLPASKDLLLFAVSAAVLQKRKFIIEKCQGLDEILRECNAMAGKLDIWQLMDDGRHLLRIYNQKVGHEKAD